jgi:hypothetical protein
LYQFVPKEEKVPPFLPQFYFEKKKLKETFLSSSSNSKVAPFSFPYYLTIWTITHPVNTHTHTDAREKETREHLTYTV